MSTRRHVRRTSRATIARFREELRRGLPVDATARSITDTVHEPAFRRAFGMEQFEGSRKGLIDAAPVPGRRRAGTGYDCKTKQVEDRATRDRIWPGPNALARTEPIHLEIEHGRITVGMREAVRMFDADASDIGAWLMTRLRSRYEKAVAVNLVRQVAYAILLRDAMSEGLAHVEHPMTLPLRQPAEMVWRWQIVPDDDADDDTEPSGEPTALEGFDLSGVLVCRWYVRGGQVRERLLIDATTVTAFTL